MQIKFSTDNGPMMRHLIRLAGTVICLYTSTALASTYSFEQAQSKLLTSSKRLQSSALLSQASQLQADAVQGLHRPNVSLNVRALSYHQTADVSTQPLINTLNQQISGSIDEQIQQLNAQGLDPALSELMGSSAQSLLSRANDRLPNELHLDAKDTTVKPSIAVTLPIYTGGAISSLQEIAQLNAKRHLLSEQERQQLEKLNLIGKYFGTQLSQSLQSTTGYQFQAMQLHVDNAYKLEQAGFISRGQRMQFEVARNHADRLYQSAALTHQQNIFEIRTLLQDPTISQLTTSLFINTNEQPNYDALLEKLTSNSPITQKLRTDVRIAQNQVTLQEASKKPKVFALGEVALDDQDWFVGVAANYTLYSGMDRSAQIKASRLQADAANLAALQATQDMTSSLHRAYLDIQNTQNTHRLLTDNRIAALENLRIQRLSFQEGFGTVADVVDAETRVHQIQNDIATNAYHYIMALATVLHHTGELDRFGEYLNRADTTMIVTE